MDITIVIKEKKVKILLMKGKAETDSLEIAEEHSLSKKLLPSIEELLTRNRLDKKDIKKMQIESDQDETFTTTRIARAVEEAWKFACR